MRKAEAGINIGRVKGIMYKKHRRQLGLKFERSVATPWLQQERSRKRQVGMVQ
jgi:hypothetical protein